MIQFRYAQDKDAIMIVIQTSTSRYSPDTLQTRKPFWYSFIFYALDTVHIRSRCGYYSISHSDFKYPDTAQIRSRRGHHSDTYSSDLQLTIQQTILDGIYKPIYNKILPSPNGIFKPIPSTIFWRVQIYGHSSVQSSFTFESRKADLPI